MSRRVPVLALVLALFSAWFTALAGAQEIGSVPRVEPSAAAPRGEVLEWTTPQGQEYWYRLPKEARGKRKPCLVLMLHGTGLNHGWSFWNYPIGSGEFRGQDIVVSPDGLTDGGDGTFNFVQNAADGDQIAELIDFFRERFEISNVYLYGHSQGAFFCYWFAGEHPERVDGIVAHAGNVLDVKHPKLAKEKIGIGILHARSDQVVPVECAERTEAIYREQGYQKLRCWIVEDIRPDAGHWPLPPHVSEMLAWLDEVCARDAASVLAQIGSALKRPTPDVALAARLLPTAHELIDAAPKAEREGLDETYTHAANAVAGSHTMVWTAIKSDLDRNDGGEVGGTYAVEVRWLRRTFAGFSLHDQRTKPYDKLFSAHDKAFEKLAKIKDKDSKAYAKALLDALEQNWFAREWDAMADEAQKRWDGGWRVVDDFGTRLAAAKAAFGTTPRVEYLQAAYFGVSGYLDANPQAFPAE